MTIATVVHSNQCWFFYSGYLVECTIVSINYFGIFFPFSEDDYSEEEKMVRAFDMNMRYGPCIGITRLQRWERAEKLGLNPPMEIKSLLESGKVQSESLWYKLSKQIGTNFFVQTKICYRV